MTHCSVLVGWSSKPCIHAAEVTGGANNKGGSSVNDVLAQSKPQTVRWCSSEQKEEKEQKTQKTQESPTWTWVHCVIYGHVNQILQELHEQTVDVFVPDHLDHPVQAKGHRDPGDFSTEAFAGHITKDSLTVCLTVARRCKQTHLIHEKNNPHQAKWTTHCQDFHPPSVPS